MNSSENQATAAITDEEEAGPNAVERFLFSRVPVWILLLTVLLGLALAVAYGAFVLHAVRGGPLLQWLQGPALAVADAPSLLKNASARTQDPFLSPPDGRPVTAGLARTDFVDPGYLLVPLYDPDRRRPLVRLVRLADGAILHEYLPDTQWLQAVAERRSTPATDEQGVPFWMGHPELLEDGSIVFKGNHLLVRASPCGEIAWLRHGHHHSVERGPEGQLWTAMVVPRPRRPRVTERYRGDAVARVSLDGRLTYVKSLDAIFAENGLEALVRGRQYSDDPHHLNDVQPVFADGPHWRRGDLFLSLGHQAMVLLYRPSTGRVIWWRIGPWLGQHDVNVVDDNRISVFDNRISFDAVGPTVLGNSRELIYDFATHSISSPWEEAFRRHRIVASSNGRGQVLANGDIIIEESNGGEVLRVSPEGMLRWHYVNANRSGERYRIFWSRYLDADGYEGAIRAAQAAQCTRS